MRGIEWREVSLLGPFIFESRSERKASSNNLTIHHYKLSFFNETKIVFLTNASAKLWAENHDVFFYWKPCNFSHTMCLSVHRTDIKSGLYKSTSANIKYLYKKRFYCHYWLFHICVFYSSYNKFKNSGLFSCWS